MSLEKYIAIFFFVANCGIWLVMGVDVGKRLLWSYLRDQKSFKASFSGFFSHYKWLFIAIVSVSLAIPTLGLTTALVALEILGVMILLAVIIKAYRGRGSSPHNSQ